VDRKIILWSLVLFFGCSILFRAIAAVTENSPKGVSIAIQAGALLLIVGVIFLINSRRRSK
jgi:uncharacterized membrane protein HdeD (DUF308 family)